MYLLESDVTPWEQSFRLGLPGWVGNHEEGLYPRSVVDGDEDGDERDVIYYSEETPSL